MSEFLHLLANPAHWLFEGVSDLVIGVLFGAVVWPRIRAHFHRDIDRAAIQVDEHLHNVIDAPIQEYPDGRQERVPAVWQGHEAASTREWTQAMESVMERHCVCDLVGADRCMVSGHWR